MTATAERQMELTLPMVPDIEIAAARAAGNLARELGMSTEAIDEMAHAIIEACINAREHSGSADKRIYVRCVGSSHGDGNPRIGSALRPVWSYVARDTSSPAMSATVY